MFDNIFEELAIHMFFLLLLLSNVTSFWRAYRMPETGSRKWLSPMLWALLWLEAVLIMGSWECYGKLNLVPLREVLGLMRVMGIGWLLIGIAPFVLFKGIRYFWDSLYKNTGSQRWLLWAVTLQTILFLLNIFDAKSRILQSVSLGTIILLVLWRTAYECLYLRKDKKILQWALSAMSVLLALWFVAGTVFYLNPMDKQLKFTIFAQVEVSYTLSSQEWEGVFSKGDDYGGPLMYSPDGPATDVPWPEGMDLDQYSYIVCYGAEMESVAINIWEVINTPYPRGIYEGKVTFGQIDYPNSIFIYQIEKIGIENSYS